MKRGTKVVAMVAVAFFALAGGEALAGGKSAKKEVTGVVNLNTATQAQLEALPGVGAKSAQAIIAYRAKTRFTRTDDLVKVKGIGPKKLAHLRPYLTLTGPSTIRVMKVAKSGSGASSPTAQGRKAKPRK
jgi:competence protein ComEA